MRIFTFGLSQSPSVPNPQSACVSSISYWFQAEQVREVFMEAACGGKPTWFLFMETFWKAKRGSLETFGLVSTEVWARGRPSEQLWKILGKRLVTVCVCVCVCVCRGLTQRSIHPFVLHPSCRVITPSLPPAPPSLSHSLTNRTESFPDCTKSSEYLAGLPVRAAALL